MRISLNIGYTKYVTGHSQCDLPLNTNQEKPNLKASTWSVYTETLTLTFDTTPNHFADFFIHTTLGRTPLDEGPARRTDLYLTTHNTHKRQTSMPPAGFEPAIPASERPQTHALERAVPGIGFPKHTMSKLIHLLNLI
jgi:hypothetical protein